MDDAGDVPVKARNGDLPRCDLVLKGGITSGVVYPNAIAELAKHYRFENIGGTSAGAIAAAVTAAAEYGREAGGFDRVGALPKDLAHNLLGMFQPLPVFRPVFDLLLAAMDGGRRTLATRFLCGFRKPALIGLVPGGLVFVPGLLCGSWGFVCLGLVLAALGAFAGPLLALWRLVTRRLPENDYGLCSGLTQQGQDGLALTDWLADTIDNVAGRGEGAGPLTVADVHGAGITVQTVTTDLSTRRPYVLPMDNNLHFFRESEFRRLFPTRVVDHMIASTARLEHEEADKKGGDFHYFKMDAMPLVVLARLSLSFPGLIAAVPLWRFDYTLKAPDHRGLLVRCLFTDGGVSSNFPVHFFDRFLPATPTFGISLGVYDERRTPGRQVSLPKRARDGSLLPVVPIDGLGGFVMTLLDAAKDWQDSLQSILPGYRERIVRIDLKGDEGGLNLHMPADRIDRLSDLGTEAGRCVVSSFDFDDHRWQRFLAEIRAIDDMLRDFAQAWDRPGAGGHMSYPDLVRTYGPAVFASLSQAQRRSLAERAEDIAALGRALAAKEPAIDAFGNRMPVSRSDLRSVARMED